MKGKVFTDTKGNFEIMELTEGMPIVCPNCGYLNIYSSEKVINGSFYCENCGFQLIVPP
ncbi:MAG: transposase [Thermodesulfovibrio sp.]|nr:transposase [Thermodesulfovibrio sp.]